MYSPILNLRLSMTVPRMRKCFEAYDDVVRKDAQNALAALDKTDVETLAPKIQEIVDGAAGRIAAAATELSDGMRLRAELRGMGGFR